MIKEELFDYMVYGNYTVHCRKLIDSYFSSTETFVSDWSDVESNHFDHKSMTTFYVKIDVYHDKTENNPVIVLSIHDTDHVDYINKHKLGVDTVIHILVDTKHIDDTLLPLFDDVYTNLYKQCSSIDYKENF